MTKVTCCDAQVPPIIWEKAGLPLISGLNMPENTKVEEIVRNAVAQTLERQLPALRETIIQEVLREIGPALAGKAEPTGSGLSEVQRAVSTIQAGTTQKEILRALLENTVFYSARAALFVIKGGSATGWQGTGFSNNNAIKDFRLDTGSGLAARVMQSRNAETAAAAEMDAHFTSKFGAPAGGKVVLLPLLLKEKISALVYADAGTEGGPLDSAALDVLVRATSAWLEVISQRKQSHKETTPESPAMAAPASATNDPFSAHTPVHSAVSQHAAEAAPEAAMSAAAPAPATNDPFSAHTPVHSAVSQHAAEAAPEAAMSAAAPAGAPAGAPVHLPAGEEGELHRKAQRFSRLLMDEIKLYNQAKVFEGRKHKDLYDRLKEDIEKSRATYQKRYGNTAAGAGDYFNQELIRSLAEDDVSLLGSNFRR